ncbi:hypothetical protein CVT26_003892 [Gymnopilus dilepis]|uniref:Uncharacterized protein n=1 Tax=Gymnopilus dilepis TaxID=231916 RepID=A0A409WPK7_9AGAR|nr:hypothetical protein CVT26_003892 [Gymnopilus dilepis]
MSESVRSRRVYPSERISPAHTIASHHSASFGGLLIILSSSFVSSMFIRAGYQGERSCYLGAIVVSQTRQITWTNARLLVFHIDDGCPNEQCLIIYQIQYHHLSLSTGPGPSSALSPQASSRSFKNQPFSNSLYRPFKMGPNFDSIRFNLLPLSLITIIAIIIPTNQRAPSKMVHPAN